MRHEAAENALRESSRMYEELLSNIPSGVYRLRIQASGVWGFDFVSSRFCELTGLTREDILNDYQVVFRIVHPDDLAGFISLNESVSKALTPFRWEGRIIVNGETCWTLVESRPSPMDNGDVIWTGHFSDITNRKRTEEALAENEKRCRLIAETIRDCFWMATPDIDKMLYVSPAYETIWGRSCESLYESPRSFVDGIHPDDRDRVSDILAEHRSQGTPCTITYRIVRPDGSIRWIEDRSFPVLDENGKSHLNIGVATDITEHKQVEEELRNSETKLRLIAETNEDVFWMCTLDNREMIYLSPSYEKVWGQTRQGVYDYPLSFMESIHPEDRERVSLLLEEHGDRHRDHEYRIVRSDGTVRWIHDRAFPVQDKNRNVQLMTGVARDVTDRKLAEETLRKSEEKFAKVFNCAPVSYDSQQSG